MANDAWKKANAAAGITANGTKKRISGFSSAARPAASGTKTEDDDELSNLDWRRANAAAGINANGEKPGISDEVVRTMERTQAYQSARRSTTKRNLSAGTGAFSRDAQTGLVSKTGKSSRDAFDRDSYGDDYGYFDASTYSAMLRELNRRDLGLTKDSTALSRLGQLLDRSDSGAVDEYNARVSALNQAATEREEDYQSYLRYLQGREEFYSEEATKRRQQENQAAYQTAASAGVDQTIRAIQNYRSALTAAGISTEQLEGAMQAAQTARHTAEQYDERLGTDATILGECETERTRQRRAAVDVEAEQGELDALQTDLTALRSQAERLSAELTASGEYDPQYGEKQARLSELNRQIQTLSDEYDSRSNELELTRSQQWFDAFEAKYDPALFEATVPVDMVETDYTYRLVNQLGQAEGSYTGLGGTQNRSYAYMTAEERNVFNTLWQRDKTEAREYLDGLTYYLNQRRVDSENQQLTDALHQGGTAQQIFTGGLLSAASVPANLVSGIGALDIAIQRFASDLSGEYRPVDYNAGWNDAYQFSTTVRSDISQRLNEASGKVEGPLFGSEGWGAGTVYETVMSVADSLAGAAVFGSGTAALLGSTAATAAMQDAHNRGASDTQAVTFGLLSGTFETLFEYVSLDHLLNNTVKGNLPETIMGILAQSGVEASEELCTTVANTLISEPVLGNLSAYSQAVQEYRDLGYEESAARKQAAMDLTSDALSDAMAGLLSGLLSGGGHTLSSTVQDSLTGSVLQRQGVQPDSLIQAIQSLRSTPETAEAVAQAQEYARKMGDGTYPENNANLSRLAQMYQAAGGSLEQLEHPGDVREQAPTAEPVVPVVSGEADTGTDTPVIQAVPEVSRETQRRIREGRNLSSALGASGARAFSGAYDTAMAEQLDEVTAFRGYTYAYNAELKGTELSEEASRAVAAIPETLRVAAEGAAQMDAARASQARYFGAEAGLVRDASFRKMHLSSQTARTLDAVAKAAGVKVLFEDTITDEQTGNKANARYADGVITIARDAENPVRTAMTHEVVHRIRETAPAAYQSLATFVQTNLSAGNYAALRQSYGRLYQTNNTSYLSEEIVADAFGVMLGDSSALSGFARENRSAAQKLLEAVRDLIAKIRRVLTGKEVRLTQEDRSAFRGLENNLTEMAYTLETALKEAQAAGREQSARTKENTAAQQSDGVRFSIMYDRNNMPYVVISEDILAGVTMDQWAKVVKENLRSAYPNGIRVGNNIISINKKSRKEMTHAEYARWLFYNDPVVYGDKLRIASNAEELLLASRDFVNEGLVHPRKDDIIDFARGTVQFRIGQRDYTAEVLVGAREGNTLLLYDVVNLARTTIKDRKKSSAVITAHPSPDVGRSAALGFEKRIADEVAEVKPKFSLRSEVEKSRTLIALHNLTAEKWAQTLKLGVFPMPSIAVTRTDVPHTNFGDITLLMRKRTVDPKADRRNTVYSADAWTPTFPRVEYEADAGVTRRIEARLEALAPQLDEMFQTELRRIRYGYEDLINRYGGEQGLIEYALENYGLKAAYLEEQGKHAATVTREEETGLGYLPDRTDKYRAVVDALGVRDAAEIGQIPMTELRAQHGEELEQVFPGMTKSAPRMSSILKQVQAWLRDQNGETARETKTVTDEVATRRAVDAALDEAAYAAWVRELFRGIEGNSGLYNGKDLYTPSGNRRSFRQTHLPFTLENIVKAMRAQNGGSTKNVSGFNGIKTLRAGMARRFASIGEMHRNEGRLQARTQEEIDALNDALGKRLYAIMEEIYNTKPHGAYDNQLIGLDSIGEMLMEIAEGGKYDGKDIQAVFSKYRYDLTDEQAEVVRELLFDVTQIPVNLFEAKPEGVVGFDEIVAAIVPAGMDADFAERTKALGIPVYTYEDGNDTARVAQVNAAADKAQADTGDVKFSLQSSVEARREAARLQQENESLRERVAYWRGQTRRTTSITVDPDSVRRAARDLLRAYNAGLAVEDVAGELQDLYSYIMNNGGADDLTFTEVRRRAEDIARTIVEHSAGEESEYQDIAKELLADLRGCRITITEEESRDIPDYNDWRKRYFGTLRVSRGTSTNIDQVYQELSYAYPEFFNEERVSSPTDQLLHIAQVVDQLRSADLSVNMDSLELEAAVSGLTGEIIEGFFEIPQARQTFADRQAAKLNAAKAEVRRKENEKRRKMRAEHEDQLHRLRERNRERLAQVRQQKDRAYRELAEHNRSRNAERRERQNARELRAKITRHANKLSQRLLKPTDNRHIPEGLRGAVAALLDGINQESRYTVDPETGKRTKNGDGDPTKRTAAFLALRERYAEILRDESTSMVVDPALEELLDRVISWRNIRMDDMNTEQLQAVWDAVKAVETSIASAGKALAGQRYARIDQWAEAIHDTADHRKGKKVITRDHVSIDLETPVTFFSHFGEAGNAVYRMLRDAQDKQQLLIDQVTAAARRIVDRKTVDTLQREAHQFTTQQGETLTLTVAQCMELLELMRRNQATEHLARGGIVQPEVRGKTADGKRVRIERGTRAIHLEAEDLARIAGVLTEEQIQIADKLQGMMSGVLADMGNEASMQAYGYRKFTEVHYWPIKSAKEQTHRETGKDGNQVRAIKNMGSAKQTQAGANNALDISGIFDTFAAHVNDMTTYAAYLCPMEDATRLFNYQFTTVDEEGRHRRTGRTVSGLLDYLGGKGAQGYWRNLMDDLQNGIAPKSDSVMAQRANRIIGNAKGAAVGANLRVILQQPTAFLRANAVLEPRDLAAGILGPVVKGKGGWKRALQHSPIAMRKEQGGFEIGNTRQMQEVVFDDRTKLARFNDAMAWGAGKADAITWGRLWNACEHQVAREHQELTPGSQGFYEEVNRVFTAMIDQTQVVDGVLQRSQIMRSGNALAKMATAFMGEPTMSLNLLMRTWDAYIYEADAKRRGKALQNMGRATVALLVTDLVNAVAQSIVDAWRDDDEDKKYQERFLAALTGYDPDAEPAWKRMMGVILGGNIADNLNPLGRIPFAKDLLSLIQGYKVTRADADVIQKIIQAAQTLATSFGPDGAKTRAYALKELVNQVSRMFGISAGNILRDVYGIGHTITVEADSVSGMFFMDSMIYSVGASGNKGRYMDLLYQAVSSGDSGGYEMVRAALLGAGYSEEDIRKALEERITRDFQAGGLDMDTALEYLSRYAADPGAAPEEEANDAYYTLRRTEERLAYEAEHGDTDGFTYSRYDDVLEAVQSGSGFDAAFQDMLDHGYSEEDVRGEIRSSIAEWYQGGAEGQPRISKDQALSWLQKYGGMNQADAEKKVNQWSSYVVTGIRYDEIEDAYLSGEITASRAVEMLRLYGGYSTEEAQSKVTVYELHKQYPDFDGELSESAVASFREVAEPAGISLDQFYDAVEFGRNAHADVDENGEAISGSKKEKILAYINGLNLTRSQKDVLYFYYGYAESKLDETPWH